ncbi:acyl-CoA N-acyltransferase, partial [Mollisia scopiformis]
MTKYVVESERLGLQHLSLEEHLEDYHAKQANEKTGKFIHREPSKSLEESRNLMIARHLPSAEAPYRELYAVLLRGSENSNGKPKMIASVGIPRVSADGKAVEVGYGVNPEYWGLGYAPEALKLFVHYYWNIRDGEKRDKIIAYTSPENIPSQRVLEKSGFAKAELIEKAYPAPDPVTKKMKWWPA